MAAVDSTNRLARRVAEAYPDSQPPPLSLIARAQTAGRGRRGRRWVSPPGQGIYASLLLPVAGAEALASWPLRVPLALCEALDEHGVACGIKWPNDLLVDGRKLGGVLLEALAGSRAAIVGFGINGAQAERELPAPGSTSLRLAAAGPVELSRLVVELVRAVGERLAEGGLTKALVEAYRRRSVHHPGDPLRCRVGDEEVAGRFAGFDDRGRLRLATAGGERVLGAAEVHHRTGRRRPRGRADERRRRRPAGLLPRHRGGVHPAARRAVAAVAGGLAPGRRMATPRGAAGARPGDPRAGVRAARRARRDRPHPVAALLRAGGRDGLAGDRVADRRRPAARGLRRSTWRPAWRPWQTRCRRPGRSWRGGCAAWTARPSEVETALAGLDEEMMSAELAGLGDDERRLLERRTAAALAALAGRIEPDDLVEARDRLLRQALRRARGLPVLSLFSSEAAAGE